MTYDSSLIGGTILTVTGAGFSDDIQVTIGSHQCDVITANYSNIECFTPAQVRTELSSTKCIGLAQYRPAAG